MVKHQSVCQIIDIFRCAREVKILLLSRQVLIRLEPLLQEVLDGLDVVVRRALDVLDALRVGLRERRHELVQSRGRVALGDRGADRGRGAGASTEGATEP